jgi:hypothetical protein
MKGLILLLFSLNLMAAKLDVRTESSELVVGDSFNVYFSIQSDENEEPNISFDPVGLEVLTRSQSGVSTRTTYINGRVSRTREITYTYELVANKTGTARLRNITVDIGGEILTHPDLRMRVKKTASGLQKFFAMAVPSKTEVFKGEPIIIRYYLYKRIRTTTFDIKKYPKLKGFLKRFMQEPPREERVKHNGQIYIRTVLYTAQLFPEKVGDILIDPIKLKVHFSESSRHDPFGGMGLGLGLSYGKMKSRTVSSERIKIKVKPIPAANVPPHFTGLVGKHSFQFQMTKNKYLINEPVEAKLIVSGPGELENFEAPKIFNFPGLEEFEINGDLKINPNFSAIKEFNYTYLARSAFSSEAKKIPLSYFDPVKLSFETVYLDFPSIEVSGTVLAGANEPKKKAGKNQEIPNREVVEAPLGVVSPVFMLNEAVNDYAAFANNILGGLILLILFFWLIRSFSFKADTSELDIYWDKIKDGQLNYSNLYQLLHRLKSDANQDIYQAIEESELETKEKNYFISLLKRCDAAQFKDGKNFKEKVDKAYFKSLLKRLKNGNHRLT